MSALIIGKQSAAPVTLICMFNEISRRRKRALTCTYPELGEHVLFCFAQGRLSGVSVPLKGIRFEGATAGELTFSPALPFSLRASMAAFNQVPRPCLCSMWCLCNSCPHVRLLSCTPTHTNKHPQRPSECSVSEQCNAFLTGPCSV